MKTVLTLCTIAILITSTVSTAQIKLKPVLFMNDHTLSYRPPVDLNRITDVRVFLNKSSGSPFRANPMQNRLLFDATAFKLSITDPLLHSMVVELSGDQFYTVVSNCLQKRRPR